MGILEVGALTTIIGMLGVFAVIVILVIFTKLMIAVVDKITGKKSDPVAAAPAVAAAGAASAAPKGTEGIPPKTVAAIMAAIQAANGNRTLKFVAIRRGTTFSHPWATSSNLDIISSRQQYL